VVAAAVVTATLLAPNALAFENQWHLGGGLGVAKYDRRADWGPLVGVHGAYGLSDSFDARLELASSLHSSEPLGSALLGVTYKLDVIQLIPWGGLAVGGYYLGDALAGKRRSAFEPGGAIFLGLDYAWSRQWGLGLAFGSHFMPLAQDRSAMIPRYTTAILRIEHRWGW
jgi:hypothetical protein